MKREWNVDMSSRCNIDMSTFLPVVSRLGVGVGVGVVSEDVYMTS
jgi:hypothetical protein